MKKIKGIDTSIFLFFLINACFILIGSKTLVKLNGINSLLTIIIGTIIGYFFINYMNYLLNKKKIKNNKFILILSSITCLLLTIYSGDKLTSFISYNMLEHVSTYIITFSFLILVVYLASKKINIIVRICELFLFLFLIIFLLELISLIKYINFKDIVFNIKEINIMNLINGINIYLLMTIAPCFYLFFINSDKFKSELKKGYIITSIYILINVIMVIGILGLDLINIYKYPEVTILKKISLLNIIDRIENLLSINMFFSLFIFISVNFYIFNEGIKKVFNIKKEKILYVVSFLIVFILINRFKIDLFGFIILLTGLMVIIIINSLIKT